MVLPSDNLRRYALAVFAHVLLVIAWQLFVVLGNVPKFVMPSPVETFGALFSGSYNWWGNVAVTATEIFAGYFLALLVGVALALAFSWSKWLEELAIPRLVEVMRGRIAATPDTGAWEKNVREAGLKRAFPHAVSCDFKVGKLGPNGEHAAYDIRRCFEIGWQAGFRGPWCIEHGGGETKELIRELRWIRDQLKQWMRESG